MKQNTLVKTNFNHHVSMDLYYEFESRIINNKNWEIKNVNLHYGKLGNTHV